MRQQMIQLLRVHTQIEAQSSVMAEPTEYNDVFNPFWTTESVIYTSIGF